MLREEFEKLTGIFPTEYMWRAIHNFYMIDESITKEQFCKEFVENKGDMQEIIRNHADDEAYDEYDKLIKEADKFKSELRAKDRKIKMLEATLDKELEWKPYEIKENVSQSDYEHLAYDRDVQIMTDEEAIKLLSDWYGFEKDRISIIKEVPVYEINRHNVYHKIGTTKRDPLYFATDMNYICFRCGLAEYELFNGDLRFFYS